MIFIGAALINRFHWIIYIFGAFLVYTGVKMFRQEDTDIQPEENPVVRALTRYIPITRHYEGKHFFTRVNGKLTGTLLLLVLIIVEVTDLVFAVDSIPRYSRSPPTLLLFTPLTFSPFSDFVRCTFCWPVWWRSSSISDGPAIYHLYWCEDAMKFSSSHSVWISLSWWLRCC